MKFKQTYQSNAHGEPIVYEFHLNLEEMKLLSGLLTNYLRHCPRGIGWLPDVRRAENMSKALKKLVGK